MENVNEIASHSEEVTPQEPTAPQVDEHQQAVKEALAAFGLEAPKDNTVDVTDNEPDDVPPTEPEPNRKGITVKYNKEEVFIDDEKIPEYARKGLNYEKVESRAKEYETALDRAARLQGFKDHSEYLSNLDRLEQEAQQRQQDQLQDLRSQLRQQAEDNGIDPDSLGQWLDTHPLLTQAQEILSRKEQEDQQRQQERAQQEKMQGWEALFRKYPELAEETPQDGSASWITPELEAKLNRGYDPIDAYELVHRDKIMSEQKRRTEQELIKQGRLNKRAAVLDDAPADPEPEVPQELASAFAAFGLDPKSAKKYAKK